MVEVGLAIVALLAIVAAVAMAVIHLQLVRAGQDQRAASLESQLGEAVDDGYLEQPPQVRLEDETIPIVRIDLDMATPPSDELAFEYVAAVLEIVHDVFTEETVDHYAVEFTFGPSGLVASGPCKRVAVPVDLADRLGDPGFTATDLRKAVEAGDDGDPDSPPVRWGPC